MDRLATRSALVLAIFPPPSPWALRRKATARRGQRVTFRVWSVLAADRFTWSAAARAAPR